MAAVTGICSLVSRAATCEPSMKTVDKRGKSLSQATMQIRLSELDTSDNTASKLNLDIPRGVSHQRPIRPTNFRTTPRTNELFCGFYLRYLLALFPGKYLIGFFGAGYSTRTPLENTIGLNESRTWRCIPC